MFRILAAVIISFLVFTTRNDAYAQTRPKAKPAEKLTIKALTLGEKVEGELNESLKGDLGYSAYFTIPLKAKQKITLIGTVVGPNRMGRVTFYDPTGKELDYSKKSYGKTSLVVDGVPTNGTYRIIMSSDLIGAFSLKVVDTDEEQARSDAANRVKLGEMSEGEFTEQNTIENSKYWIYRPVQLNAGQSLLISATVIGTGRSVQLYIADPTGRDLAGTSLTKRSVELKVREVSATGKYTIQIASDRVGAYRLMAVDPATSGIDYNEPFNGELSENSKSPSGSSYMMVLPIQLNEGRPLKITATVKGTSRSIGLTLYDRTGLELADQRKTPQTVTMTIREINATGLGKIEVYSDQVGPFTLTVVDPEAAADEGAPADQPTEKMLEDKIQRHEGELHELKTQLRAIKSKKSGE